MVWRSSYVQNFDFMAKRKDLLSFLFGESAELESAESDQQDLKILENLERFFEDAAEAEQSELKAKKTPLAKALSEFGISDADLQMDPEGFVIVTDNHDKYVDAVTVLSTADAMHKLAEMGWVVTKPGDVAMTNEPAEYKIRFLEITTVEQNDREPKGGGYDTANREEVIKKAEEFATTPMDRDDDLNPVENGDGKMSKKNVGLGKAKDGEEPEKAIHDALADAEGTRIEEFTSTGSMGTVMPQGQPFVGMVKKPKPYGKGTKFKTPGQWTVKQPVVKEQVKRKVHSESTDPVEQAAEAFLSEEGPAPAAPVGGDDRCHCPGCDHCAGEPGHCERRATKEAFAGEEQQHMTDMCYQCTFHEDAPAGDGNHEPDPEAQAAEAYQDMEADLESGECAILNDRASGPTRVTLNGKFLGNIGDNQTFPDWESALAAIKAAMDAQKFWPNIYHINDHGNVSLLDGNGNTVQSWV